MLSVIFVFHFICSIEQTILARLHILIISNTVAYERQVFFLFCLFLLCLCWLARLLACCCSAWAVSGLFVVGSWYSRRGVAWRGVVMVEKYHTEALRIPKMNSILLAVAVAYAGGIWICHMFSFSDSAGWDGLLAGWLAGELFA